MSRSECAEAVDLAAGMLTSSEVETTAEVLQLAPRYASDHFLMPSIRRVRATCSDASRAYSPASLSWYKRSGSTAVHSEFRPSRDLKSSRYIWTDLVTSIKLDGLPASPVPVSCADDITSTTPGSFEFSSSSLTLQ